MFFGSLETGKCTVVCWFRSMLNCRSSTDKDVKIMPRDKSRLLALKLTAECCRYFMNIVCKIPGTLSDFERQREREREREREIRVKNLFALSDKFSQELYCKSR